MTTPELAAAAAGACVAVAVLLAAANLRGRSAAPGPAAPLPPWLRALRRVWAAATEPGRARGVRRRAGVGVVAGVAVWAVTGWPVAGLAAVAAAVWLPWLLGSARVVRQRLETVEALEAWCRRMADTLVGGGAIGLAEAITTTAVRVDEPIAVAVRRLARRLQLEQTDPNVALREFADTVDDRAGDAVAAALLLALHQQSTGIAQVLRQLADGVARDVRARREIEAARAESRQSIRMLLVIQAALLALMVLVPAFSAPYRSPLGQVVMAVLLSCSAGLLVWMRRLSLGRPAPRFLGKPGGFAP